MPPEAEWIIKNIRDHGFEAFAVGGCVRDLLLGRDPEDWDITTSAKPEEIKEIFGHTIDTGIKHGTVTVIRNHRGYEVTTYRIDGKYLDGRHPESVDFTTNLLEDLKRRDFTVNALAYSEETGIVDEFGGFDDLKRKRIRCVGNAHDRFTEDALRMLRALRFSAQLDFDIEEKTYLECSCLAPNLSKVSRERVQAEITKLLISCHPERAALIMDTGLAEYVTDDFPEVFEHDSYSSLRELPPEKDIRWAGFLRFLSPDKARKILRDLKLDNETTGNAKKMILVSQTPIAPEKPAIRREMSEVTPRQFDGGLELKAINSEPGAVLLKKLTDEIRDDGDCVSLKDLAVKGEDLIALGLRPGKEIGDTLSGFLDAVIADPGMNRREILISLIGK